MARWSFNSNLGPQFRIAAGRRRRICVLRPHIWTTTHIRTMKVRRVWLCWGYRPKKATPSRPYMWGYGAAWCCGPLSTTDSQIRQKGQARQAANCTASTQTASGCVVLDFPKRQQTQRLRTLHCTEKYCCLTLCSRRPRSRQCSWKYRRRPLFRWVR